MAVSKRTEYERTSRQRAEMRAAAVLLGWTALDVLGAYLTEDQTVVVVTKDGKRYGAQVVAPESFVPETPETSAQQIEPRDSKLIEAVIDLSKTEPNRDKLLTKLKGKLKENPNNSHAIALIETTTDSPDWVSEIKGMLK